MNTVESRLADLEAAVKEVREQTVRDVIDAVQVTKERVFKAELQQLRKELGQHVDVLSKHVSAETQRAYEKLESTLGSDIDTHHSENAKTVETLHERHVSDAKTAAAEVHEQQAANMAEKHSEQDMKLGMFKEAMHSSFSGLRQHVENEVAAESITRTEKDAELFHTIVAEETARTKACENLKIEVDANAMKQEKDTHERVAEIDALTKMHAEACSDIEQKMHTLDDKIENVAMKMQSEIARQVEALATKFESELRGLEKELGDKLNTNRTELEHVIAVATQRMDDVVGDITAHAERADAAALKARDTLDVLKKDLIDTDDRITREIGTMERAVSDRFAEVMNLVATSAVSHTATAAETGAEEAEHKIQPEEQTYDECEQEYSRRTVTKGADDAYIVHVVAATSTPDTHAAVKWSDVAHELGMPLFPAADQSENATVNDTLDEMEKTIKSDLCDAAAVFNHLKNNYVYHDTLTRMQLFRYAVFISSVAKVRFQQIGQTQVARIVDAYEHKAVGDIPASPRAALELVPTVATEAATCWVVPPIKVLSDEDGGVVADEH